MMALTDRQLEALRTFAALTVPVGPPIRVLGDALGISSTNGVNDLLRALEAKGVIKRIAERRARCYVLTELGLALIDPRAKGGHRG